MPDEQPITLADRYRLIGLLGHGGMGRVWTARDELLGREVAVKEMVLPSGLTPSEVRDLRERAIREARAIARLDHRNVVRIFDVLFENGQPWIVMELVPSRSLFEVIGRDGPMAPARAAQIGLGVLAALRAAHRSGLLHRDVKPANVLLADDGRVVLTDFGLAAADGDTSMTQTGIVLGSPAYLAPERALGGEIGPAADLWSLGATLYAAVEGKPPYDRSSPIATLAALATEPPTPAQRAGVLLPALRGLLEKDPARRIDAETAQRMLQEATEATTAIPMAPAVPMVSPMPAAAAPQLQMPAPPRGQAPDQRAGDQRATGQRGMDQRAAEWQGTQPPVVAGPDQSAQRRPAHRRRWLIAGAVVMVIAAMIAVRPLLTIAQASDHHAASGAAGSPAPSRAAGRPVAQPTGSGGHRSHPAAPAAAAPSASTTPASAPAIAPTAPPTAPAIPTGPPPSAPATTAATSGPAGRPITNKQTGTCLYAPVLTGAIKLWTCDGSAAQRFRFPADGTLRVRGRCVQVSGTDDGTRLKLAACDGSPGQQFTFNSAYDLVSILAIKCVDVPNGSPADGVPAQIWKCAGTGQQKWTY